MSNALSQLITQATRTLKALEILMREATESFKEERKEGRRP